MSDQSNRGSRRHILTLAMIVRDEGARLAECLASVKPIVDEIVVVDTGSSDNTLEIARSCGARTFKYKWRDDFSAARNESLRHATGDWVIVLDADEIVAPEDLPRVRQFVEEDTFDAVQFILANYCDECQSMWWRPVEKSSAQARGYSGYIGVPLVRMWRNKDEFRFEGRVHETVIESIRRARGRIAETDITVHHYGKAAKAQEKSDLYVKLGKRNVEERPSNPKAHYDLATQLKELGRLEEAERHYRIALSLDPESYRTQSGLVQVLAQSGRLAEAEAMLERMDVAGGPPSVSVNLAILYMKRGRLKAAAERLRKALSQNPTDVVAHIYWGKVQERCADTSSAERAYRKAVDICPAFAPARAALSGFEMRTEAKRLLASGDGLAALRVLKDAVREEPTDGVTYNDLGSALASLGQTEAAYRMFLRGLACEPRLAVLRRNLEETANALGRTDEAQHALAEG